MPGDLVELARFPSSAEAAIVRGRLDAEGIRAQLDGEAMASWFWFFGSAVGGVRLLVNEDDLDRALEVLGSDACIDETEDIDFGDESADDVTDGDEPELPEDLIRAWRAALIGFFLLPPLLNIYSMWLLFRHRFFADRGRNWRVPAACVANAVVFALVIWIGFLIASPPEMPLPAPAPDGKPIDVQRDTYTIPLVPVP